MITNFQSKSGGLLDGSGACLDGQLLGDDWRRPSQPHFSYSVSSLKLSSHLGDSGVDVEEKSWGYDWGSLTGIPTEYQVSGGD